MDGCDVLVIGGGFFGCAIATMLAGSGHRVSLVEERGGLLERASRNNQARVHRGYHYPRSVLTALRSRINFPRWVAAYKECVVEDFDSYYAVARRFSKVSALQFEGFMRRVDAPLSPAPSAVERLFDPELIERVYTAREFVFDASLLADMMMRELDRCGVRVMLNTRAVRVSECPGGLSVELDGQADAVKAKHVFHCAYSQMNRLLVDSGLPTIRLKHELAEMALTEPPEELRHMGITVMCGPFFSLMPFPALGLHTLSHVRYTPHAAWEDNAGQHAAHESFRAGARPPSHWAHMLADARRYLPALRSCKHRDSLWEVKTVLPASEADDSRPILHRRDHGLRGLHCVMGAKIDNIFDALAECALLV